MSKLTIRLQGTTKRVVDIIESFADHANVEIQQRACEYIKIFEAGKWDEEERAAIFDFIPFKGDENMLVDTKNRKIMGDEDDGITTTIVPTKSAVVEDVGLDIDLMMSGSTPQGSQPTATATGDVMDLLDVFGTGPPAQQPQ